MGVVVVRRRSVAVALVTLQALVLAGVAASDATSGSELVAAVALGVRAVALAALLLVLIARTREPQRVRAGSPPLTRAVAGLGFALALTWLVPEIGLSSRSAERAVLALMAFGIVTAATRRATLFQVMGIVLVENGLALAALNAPGHLVACDRARRRIRPDARRACRRRVPRADLRRVRRGRHRGSEDAA